MMIDNNRDPGQRIERNDDVQVPHIRVMVRTFQFPLVRDAAVIGRLAPISAAVMVDVLGIISQDNFLSLSLRNRTVKCIVARESVVRKIGWERLTRIVRSNIIELMSASEIIALNLEIEIALGENSLP